MKNIFILSLIVFTAWSCEQIKIPNCNNTLQTKTYNEVYTNNGYSSKECVKTSLQIFKTYEDYYCKVVFYTKTHGIIATDYAYSVSVNNYNKKHHCGLKYVYTPFRKYSLYFIKKMTEKLGDELNDFFISSSHETSFIGREGPVLLFRIHANIFFLNKNQYENFRKKYPDIIQMNENETNGCTLDDLSDRYYIPIPYPGDFF